MAGCLRSSRRVRRRRRRRQLDGWVQTLRVYPSRSFSFLHHVVASASFALHSRISRPCRALEPDLRRSFGAVSRSRSTLPSGRFPSAALGGRLAGAVSEPGSSAVEACPNLRERARVSNLEEQRSGRAPTPQFRFAPDVLRRLTVCDSSSARRRSRKSDRSTFARRPSSPADASFPLRCPPDEPNLASPARCSAEAGSSSALARHKGVEVPGPPNSPTVRPRRTISSSLSPSPLFLALPHRSHRFLRTRKRGQDKMSIMSAFSTSGPSSRRPQRPGWRLEALVGGLAPRLPRRATGS